MAVAVGRHDEIIRMLTEIRDRVVKLEDKVDAVHAKVETLEISNRLEETDISGEAAANSDTKNKKKKNRWFNWHLR